MKRWKVLMIVMFVFSGRLPAQDGPSRPEEGLRVEYAATYNVQFGRGRLDRPYLGLLRISGHGSYSCLVQLPDTAGPAQGGNDVFIGADTVMQVWKALETDRLVFLDLSLSGHTTPYSDTLHPMAWRLLPERRQVAGLDCHRAETRFRGRNYVAWYAPSIPLPHGPWKLGGLPGLIVEAHDEEMNLVFRMRSMVREGTAAGEGPAMPSVGIGDYAAYQRYWQGTFRRLRRSLAAQSEAGCLSCRTQTKMSFHTWESIPE